jgi:tetratricopeptide (TPR) repeat protein
MPAHTNPSHSEFNGGRESNPEQARLDEAVRRADDLLVSSLKSEDRRRSRRKLALGATCVGLGIVAAVVIAVSSHFSVHIDSTAVAGDSEEKAAQLSAEGWQFWKKLELQPAIEKFEAAVKLDPKNAAAWNGLGWANFSSANSEPAQAAFKKVLALEPKHPAALNGLGQIALSQRNYREAEDYLLKAARQAPAAYYGLAKVYLLTGKYDQAEKYARKILAEGETDPVARELLKAAEAKKLPAELREQLEPNPGQLEVARAWQLINQGRHAEAKAILTPLVTKYPKDATLLNSMGWCLLTEGDAEGAKPYFERALAADPKAAGAMNGLARVLYASGDVDGAIKTWKEMVEKFPGVHAGTIGLADAYFEKGEYKKALPLLEKWVASDLHNEEAQNKLELAREKAKKK